jgi:hypothetical protein
MNMVVGHAMVNELCKLVDSMLNETLNQPYLSCTLLCTTSENQIYNFSYVFIWFSIIHHYLCQCQI